MTSSVFTFCKYCAARCGIEVTVEDNRITHIAPDKQNPHNWRDFCPKALHAAEIVEHPRRIVTPMRRAGDRYVEATYEDAVDDIAGRLRRLLDRHGPDSIGFYSGNPLPGSTGNLMFSMAFMDAIGTGSRYSVGSVDQNNNMVVTRALYNIGFLYQIPDVDECDCFLFVGTNPVESRMNWIDTVPNGWNRVRAAQARGADLIVVDPRRTPSAEHADTHVAIRPGQDWAFLLAVVKLVFEHGWDRPDPAKRFPAEQMAALRALCDAADVSDLAARSGVDEGMIRDVARRYATARTGMCVTRTGVSQHTTGTIGEWLGAVLDLLTDHVDRPGGKRPGVGFFDLVASGEEHRAPIDHRSRVRGLPMVEGAHSLAELPDEITADGPGRVRALFINCGNPVVSGPDGAALDAALAQLELLVSVDLIQRDSHRHADWLIPGTHWLERGELNTVFSGLHAQPFIQFSAQAVEPPPTVRPEWEFWFDLAVALDVDLFGAGMNEQILESRQRAEEAGDPELAITPTMFEKASLESGGRVTWDDVLAHPHGMLYADTDREFRSLTDLVRTEDGRINIAPPEFVEETRRLLAAPLELPPPEFPLTMISRRRITTMNSWLNDLPGLRKRTPGNTCEINALDAAELGVASGDRVRVTSARGAIELEAVVSDAPRRGVVVIEQCFGSTTYDPRGDAPPDTVGVNRNVLVSNREIDPLSQTPRLNSTYVRVERVAQPA